MIIRTLALAAAFSALAGAALADGAGQATLQKPLAKRVEVVAGDGYWVCQGSSCTSGSASDQTLTVSACKDLVKAAGPVTDFSVGGVALKPAQLAKCVGTQSQASAR
jgi:hypothetical protein